MFIKCYMQASARTHSHTRAHTNRYEDTEDNIKQRGYVSILNAIYARQLMLSEVCVQVRNRETPLGINLSLHVYIYIRSKSVFWHFYPWTVDTVCACVFSSLGHLVRNKLICACMCVCFVLLVVVLVVLNKHIHAYTYKHTFLC